MVANREAESWDPASDDEHAVQTDRARDVVQRGDPQPDLDARPHRLAHWFIDHLDLVDVRSREADVPHQTEDSLRRREADLERVVGEQQPHRTSVTRRSAMPWRAPACSDMIGLTASQKGVPTMESSAA